MKKLILIVGLLMTASQSWATWTADLLRVDKTEKGDRVTFHFQFVNGSISHNVDWENVAYPSESAKRQFCINQISDYERIDSFVSATVLGPVDTSPQTPTPTPAEIARDKYFSDRAKLASLNQLIGDGGLTGNEKEYLDLVDAVKAGFKKEYFDLP